MSGPVIIIAPQPPKCYKYIMKILAIETSCDETAISIIEADGDFSDAKFKILANVVHSQIPEHTPYGGVFPAIAKREHSKNLIPVLVNTLQEAKLHKQTDQPLFNDKLQEVEKILEREPELSQQFLEILPTLEIPDIDAIAVTYGPGLEPALWVGINFAKALSLAWNKPIIATNHMLGHVFSTLLNDENPRIEFPAIALLVSGGHTELILVKDWDTYEKIGQTRDDAVGEAFDKVARLLDLPYPGGPEISRLAEKLGLRESKFEFPRPMLHSKDFDFSFSGLKTSVLYTVKKLGELTQKDKEEVAHEFQQAAIDVLVKKTIVAAQKYEAKTIILGGGVAANSELRKQLTEAVEKNLPDSTIQIPDIKFTGDNAAMIAIAGYFTYLKNGVTQEPLKIEADGNLSF
ncbi:tRNA (adenosine(37)-N6)-threonylcarbamoyltransferase complex transferase subunit TsaD [Patescibacteria group bacterium]